MSSPCLPPGAGTPEGPTMVLLGLLAATLLPPSLTLLLVHLSSSQDVASDPSSEQQLCALREHPTVAFADLKPWVSNFTYPGVRDFSQLALDPSRNQLIVGARNYLFRLSLANVSLLQQLLMIASWIHEFLRCYNVLLDHFCKENLLFLY